LAQLSSSDAAVLLGSKCDSSFWQTVTVRNLRHRVIAHDALLAGNARKPHTKLVRYV